MSKKYHSSSTRSSPRLVPIIYAGTTTFGLILPNTDTDRTVAESLAIDLSQLSGSECIIVDISTKSVLGEIIHARATTHQVTHILNITTGDLNTFLLSIEPRWNLIDSSIALSLDANPNLSLLVELGQLTEQTLDRFEEYVQRQLNQMATVVERTSTSAVTSIGKSNSSAAAISSDPATPGFSCATWNTLSCDYSSPKTFFYTEPEHLHFDYRLKLILSELSQSKSDIQLMQEVDYDAVEEGRFDSPNFGSIFLRRPNHKRDGLLIRFNEELFELMEIPQLITLDGSFAKHATQRKNDSVDYRIHTSKTKLCTLQPRIKKKDLNEAKSTTVDHTVPKEIRALMKRQCTILDRLNSVEDRLDALQAKVVKSPTLSLQRSISQERGESMNPPDESASGDELPPIHIPSAPAPSAAHVAHGVSTLFHAVHMNDLCLLTRTKKNSSSQLFFDRYRKENIGLCVLLKYRSTGDLVLVVNCHLFWNPTYVEVKIAQTQYMLQQMQEIVRILKEKQPDARISVVLGGDFNSTPGNATHRLLAQGRTEVVQYIPTAEDIAKSTKQQAWIVPPEGESSDDDDEDELLEQIMSAPLAVVASSSSSTSVISPLSSISSPNTRVRLLLDGKLAKLRTWFRSIGVDTECPMPKTGVVISPEEYVEWSKRENRILILRDRQLGEQIAKGVIPIFRLPRKQKDPREIFLDVCQRFGFIWEEALFCQRCMMCNSVLEQYTPEQIAAIPNLPEKYKSEIDDDGTPLYLAKPFFLAFCVNPSCHHIRWWSSQNQKDNQMRMFQARLGMELNLGDEANEPEPTTAPSPEAVNSLRTQFASEAELLAARAARKANRVLARAEKERKKAENAAKHQGAATSKPPPPPKKVIQDEDDDDDDENDDTGEQDGGEVDEDAEYDDSNFTRAKKQSMSPAELRATKEKIRFNRVVREYKKIQRILKNRALRKLGADAKKSRPTTKPPVPTPALLRDPSLPDASATAPPTSFALTLHQYWQRVMNLVETPTGEKHHTHPFAFLSAYGPTEPQFTNCTPTFLDTLDYLFYSSDTLVCTGTRQLPTKADLDANDIIGCPHQGWPSDHELLVARYQFRPKPT